MNAIEFIITRRSKLALRRFQLLHAAPEIRRHSPAPAEARKAKNETRPAINAARGSGRPDRKLEQSRFIYLLRRSLVPDLTIEALN